MNPAAGELLDAMAADHAADRSRGGRVRAAAARWAADDAERAAPLDAINALEDVLLPHLEREESEAMPLVSATITPPPVARVGPASTTSSPSRCRSWPKRATVCSTGSTPPGGRSWRHRCRGCRADRASTVSAPATDVARRPVGGTGRSGCRRDHPAASPGATRLRRPSTVRRRAGPPGRSSRRPSGPWSSGRRRRRGR